MKRTYRVYCENSTDYQLRYGEVECATNTRALEVADQMSPAPGYRVTILTMDFATDGTTQLGETFDRSRPVNKGKSIYGAILIEYLPAIHPSRANECVFCQVRRAPAGATESLLEVRHPHGMTATAMLVPAATVRGCEDAGHDLAASITDDLNDMGFTTVYTPTGDKIHHVLRDPVTVDQIRFMIKR